MAASHPRTPAANQCGTGPADQKMQFWRPHGKHIPQLHACHACCLSRLVYSPWQLVEIQANLSSENDWTKKTNSGKAYDTDSLWESTWYRHQISQRPARNSTSCTSGWFQLQGTPHHINVNRSNRSCLCLKLSEYIWDGTNLPCWNSFSRPLGTALSVCHIRTVNILKLSTRTGCQPRTLCHWDTQRHSKTLKDTKNRRHLPNLQEDRFQSKLPVFRVLLYHVVSLSVLHDRGTWCSYSHWYRRLHWPRWENSLGQGSQLHLKRSLPSPVVTSCTPWVTPWPVKHIKWWPTKPRSSAWAGAASLGLQKVWKVCRICITESRYVSLQFSGQIWTIPFQNRKGSNLSNTLPGAASWHRGWSGSICQVFEGWIGTQTGLMGAWKQIAHNYGQLTFCGPLFHSLTAPFPVVQKCNTIHCCRPNSLKDWSSALTQFFWF